MALTRRHASDWFEVEVDREAKRVVVRRLAPLFASKEEAQLACAPVIDVVSSLDRSSHTLLFDARQARGVNDPDYESWYAPLRREIVRGFAKVAILVKSASGALQAKRLASADRAQDDFRVFDDLGKAQRYLTGR